MMDENLIKIDLEDIQDLIIQKKFVRINSDKYTDNAFNYVKYLIDQERAILFDADTHRIYTLGGYYGGDELKENLLYFSKLLSIDVDNEILDEIDALQNSDTLAFRGKDALKINFVKDKYNTIEFEYSLENAINNNPFKFNPDNEYHLYIDENGQIALYEYIYPKVIIDSEPLLPEDEESQILNFNILSSIDFDKWETFHIDSENCTIDNLDLENHKIYVTFHKGTNGHIIINYSDGKNQDTYEYIQKWYNECKYGLFDGNNYVEDGNFYYLDDNINPIIIDQKKLYQAYIILPNNINPIFIDNNTNIQGAWHKVKVSFINQNSYELYVTDNSGLGKIEWKIKNKKI